MKLLFSPRIVYNLDDRLRSLTWLIVVVCINVSNDLGSCVGKYAAVIQRIICGLIKELYAHGLALIAL